MPCNTRSIARPQESMSAHIFLQQTLYSAWQSLSFRVRRLRSLLVPTFSLPSGRRMTHQGCSLSYVQQCLQTQVEDGTGVLGA
jgi:hypothetical protein